MRRISATVLDSAVVFVGRGGSGTRILSDIATGIGMFLGNTFNPTQDSIEWVSTIYALLVARLSDESADTRDLAADLRNWGELIPRGLDFVECDDVLASLKQSGATDILRRRAAAILASGNWAEDTPWGWKLPETLLVIADVLAAFPRAKIVHLVRHPVVSSLRRTHMTSRASNPIGAAVLRAAYVSMGRDKRTIGQDPDHIRNAITWRYQVDHLTGICRGELGSDRYLELRYENMCESPEKTVTRLAAFVGVPEFKAFRVDVDSSRSGHIDPNDPRVEEVWSLCADVARPLGYGLSDDRRPVWEPA